MLLWSHTSQLWQHPKKLSAGSPEKSRSIGTFFSFLVQKQRFSRMVIRHTLGRPVRLCPKNSKFHTSSPKKHIEKKLIKNYFSPKCSSGSVDCWFGNPDKLSGREFRFFYPVFLFCISSELKASSDCFSGQVYCSLDHFFWILEKKVFR